MFIQSATSKCLLFGRLAFSDAYVPSCRFVVKVTALWEQGSNADVALDDFAVGAACFNTGKQLLLCHHSMVVQKTFTTVQNIFVAIII